MIFARCCTLLGLAGVLLAAGCDKTQQSASSSSNDAGPKAIVSKSGVQMIALPGGTFTMGTADGNPEEGPAHSVTVLPFLIDAYEVTHEMFVKVQLPDPSHWQDDPKGPVERIRWRDAKAYCNERSRLEGLSICYNEKTVEWDCNYSADGYRLPTEAEWEYAARAGSTGPYESASAQTLGQYAWYADNSNQMTHPVGQKRANAWGIFDMLGNVSEWCEDVYSPTYYQQSPANDPTGPAGTGKDVKRVMRGGNWNANADACRVTFRQGQRTGNTDACFATDFCGFRCVRRAGSSELAQLTAAPK